MSMAPLSFIVPWESQFPVHVRILPNLWGHTLKGGRYFEYRVIGARVQHTGKVSE